MLLVLTVRCEKYNKLEKLKTYFSNKLLLLVYIESVKTAIFCLNLKNNIQFVFDDN